MKNECVEELKKNVMGEVSEVWLGGCRREMLKGYFNAFNRDNIVFSKRDLKKIIKRKSEWRIQSINRGNFTRADAYSCEIDLLESLLSGKFKGDE